MFFIKKGMNKKHLFLITISLLLSAQLALAKNWFEVFSDSTFEPVNAVASLSGDMSKMIAVGDNGYFFVTHDFGHWMDMRYSGFPENLLTISYAREMYGTDSLLVAAGENGRVLYFDFMTESWQPVDTLGSQAFRSSFYDFPSATVYLAGDSSTVYYSTNFGQTWNSAIVEISNLSSVQITGGNPGVVLIGVRNDTTFILEKSAQAPVFSLATADTIPNFVAASAAFIQDLDYNQHLYIAGNVTPTGEGQIWVEEYLDGNLLKPVMYFSGIDAAITSIGGGSDYYSSLFWLTTVIGDVWESVDGGKFWYKKYTDPRQRKLGPLFVQAGLEGNPDPGRIFGAQGVILKYGFELRWFYPHRNAHVDHPLDRLELGFSSPAELDSIRNGVFISSNISGSIPFSAEYDPGDSTLVYLYPSRFPANGTVPGEKWRIILSDRIREVGDSTGEPFRHSSYGFDILPENGSGFQFKPTQNPVHHGSPISNPVVGFFNNDDTFDLIYYAGDTLYCYSPLADGNLELKQRIYVGAQVALIPQMGNQLLAEDIDNDGRLDLILYDQTVIRLIENRSDTQFDFILNPNAYFSSAIDQVLPYSADNNSETDLLVLNDTLFTLMNIGFGGFGLYKNIGEFDAAQFTKMELGDIDLDGYTDLVLLNQTGNIAIKRGSGYGYFYDTFTTDKQGYSEIHLADLDNDSDLEVVAVLDNELEALVYDWDNYWSFYPTLLYTTRANQNIAAFAVQNFGTNNRNNGPLLMDIALLAGDSVKILENQSFGQNNFMFQIKSQESQQLPFSAGGLLFADFDKNAYPDLIPYHTSPANIEIFYKATWRPTISEVLYHHGNEIEIRWDVPPADMGTVRYYRVARDSIPEISEQAWIRDANEPFFIDYEISQSQTYWYSVAAVFEDGSESSWSEPVQAQLFIELFDELTTDLLDSNRVYLARSDLSIPAGSNVQIGPGVSLVFEAGTGLDVFGGLVVKGDSIDDGMAEIYGIDHQPNIWRGITLHPAADTVVFDWFVVMGAQTAIKAQDRPLHISRGGLQFNTVALETGGDTLAMSNVLIDSNLTAAILDNNTRASIKNLSVLHTFETGFQVVNGSRAKIRNSIFWFNQGPSLISEVPADQLFIGYSTVDSIAGNRTQVEITREAPLFMPPDSGFYRMEYQSPTIDAGFPGDDVGEEPQPNGGVINQGVFGGLYIATPTLAPRIQTYPKETFQQVRPAISDTVLVYIGSAGSEPLELYSVGLTGGSGVFSLGDIPNIIQPGDTVALPVVFTPLSREEYNDTLIIESNDTRVFYRTRRIFLYGRGLNSPPYIIGSPVTFARVDEAYEYAVRAQDADGDSLTFTALELPAWLNMSPQGVLSGTPATVHIGKHPVRIEVSDGFGGTDMLEFEITVLKKDDSGILAPRAFLTEFPDPIVFQSGVRMDFIVADDEHNPLDREDIRIRYFLQNLALDDLPVITDTMDIDYVTYVNLEDGDYLFKVWAYDSLGRGYGGEKADSVRFEIRTFRRQALRHRWYLMSFPRGESLSWEQFEYPDSAAMMLVWDNQEEDYLPLNRDQIPPGSGFWVMPMQQLEFDLSSYERLQPGDAAGEALTRPLQKGWNQVGTPVDYSTAWKNIRFYSDSTGQEYTMAEAVQEGFVDGAVHWFLQIGDKQGYNLVELDTAALAYPWLGYWLKTNGTGTITFTTEPAFRNGLVAVTNDSALGKPLAKAKTGWKINIALQNDHYSDLTNILGAGLPRDRHYNEPPPFGEYCAFYFTGKEGRSSINYTSKNAGLDEAISWDAVVESRSGQKEHTLQWDISQAAEQGVHLLLVDRQKEIVIPMDEQDSYTFVPRQRYYKFRIYASTDASFKPEMIPLSFRLEQNYPNPFNPRTTIRFGLPEEAAGLPVVLKVYDILGREVATLLNGNLKAGYHEVQWDGKNASGQAVASGVYFYRLQTGNTPRMVRKMILLR